MKPRRLSRPNRHNRPGGEREEGREERTDGERDIWGLCGGVEARVSTGL